MGRRRLNRSRYFPRLLRTLGALTPLDRRLDLERARFLISTDHLVVHLYRCVLARAVRELHTEAKWKGLRAVMELMLKWAGPR
jgi:hypothetical protein